MVSYLFRNFFVYLFFGDFELVGIEYYGRISVFVFFFVSILFGGRGRRLRIRILVEFIE